jgi:hypothetical protein
MPASAYIGSCIAPSDVSSLPVPPPRLLAGNLLDLVFSGSFRLEGSGSPVYRFDIMTKSGRKAGYASLVADPRMENVALTGHIGGEFMSPVQSPEAIAEATSLLFPLARESGLDRILITCRSGDPVITKTCRLLHARSMDTVGVRHSASEKRVTLRRFICRLDP